MNGFWETLLRWIGQHWVLERLFLASLEFAALAVLAALVLWLVKPRTPRLVAFVWALILAKPVVSLVFGSPIDLVRFSVSGVRPEIEQAQAPVTTSQARKRPANDSAYSLTEDNGSTILPPEHGRDSEAREATSRNEAQTRGKYLAHADEPAVQAAVADPGASTRRWDWPLSVVGFWLSGVLVMALRALIVRRRLTQILRNGRLPNNQVQDIYRATFAAMNVHRPPRLLVTNAIESPALVGLWRPTILIPEWLAEPSNHAALTWALRHELTHWKYGDLWLIRLREIVRMLFYFHPAAWWAGRRLETALEIACDRAVIANETEAADYAQRLYEILDAVRNRRRQPLAGGLFATRSQIARRLQMLVESPLRLHARLTKTAVLGISLLAAMVLAVGSGLRHEVSAQDAAAKNHGDDQTKETEPSQAVQSRTNSRSPAKEPVAGGVNVVGKAVDESGKPVEGVSIRLYAPIPDAATTKSDANGRFSFLMRQERPGTLVAMDDEGKRIGYGPCYPIMDDRYAPRIALKPAHEVTVKVVDAHGAPVAGATWASPGAQWDLDDLLFTGKTGEDGTARLRFSYDARPYQVIAFKSGVGFDYFVTTRQPGQDFHEQLSGEITLMLSAAKTLTLKAEDQNRQPVQGVSFALRRFKKPEAKEALSISGCDAVQVVTNARGEAVFDWLPQRFDDSLRFNCDSREYIVREARRPNQLLWVRHDDPVKELIVPVLRRASISGKVVGPDGKPLAGITMQASGTGGGRNGRGGRGEIKTDADGRYRINVESERVYAVGLVDDRWAAPDQVDVVVRENQPAENIDFKVGEGTLVRGMVIDQASRPVANYQVVLRLETGPRRKEIAEAAGQRARLSRLPFIRRSQSDGNGRFQFRVGPGNYKLVATETGAYNSQTPQADLTVDDQREIVRDLLVQIEEAALLKGKLLDLDGKPVPNQRVYGSYLERPIDEETSFIAQTGADGTFQVQRKPLPAVLRPLIEDRTLGARVVITADQNEVTLQLQRLVEAHGRFLDDKGEAAPGRRIQSDVLFSEAVTDVRGRFTLVGLLPGEEHSISLFENGRLQHLTKLTLKGPGPVDLGDLRVPPIPDQEALTLKGKVIDSDGSPVAGVEVRAVFQHSWSRGRSQTARVKTSADGSFEVKRPAVPAVLTARTANNQQGGMLQVDEKQAEAVLRMVPLGKARGILTDSSGKPMPGATIVSWILIRVSGGHTLGVLDASATTADDGSYALDGLLPQESHTVQYFEMKNNRAVRREELTTFKLEKAETVVLGRTPLPK